MKETIRVRMTITTGTVFAFNVEKRSVDQQEVTLYGNYKDVAGFKREARKVTGFKQIDVDNIKVESKHFDISIDEFMKVAKEVDLEKEATEKKSYTGAKRGRKPKTEKEFVSSTNTKDIEEDHEDAIPF